MGKYGKAPGDVPFIEEGAAVLAKAVAESIEANLSLRND
jgi:hypothetical protein